MTTEIAELDKQIEEIKGLENQRERLVARMKVIGELQRSRPEVVHLFDEIVKAVPEGVHLTEVKQTGNRIELQGMAQSSTRVSTLMRNIDSSDWLSRSGPRRGPDRRGRHGASVAVQAVRTAGRDYERGRREDQRKAEQREAGRPQAG